MGKICDNGIDVLFRKGYAVTIDAKTGKELTRHPRENGTYRFKAELRAPKQGVVLFHEQVESLLEESSLSRNLFCFFSLPWVDLSFC